MSNYRSTCHGETAAAMCIYEPWPCLSEDAVPSNIDLRAPAMRRSPRFSKPRVLAKPPGLRVSDKAAAVAAALRHGYIE